MLDNKTNDYIISATAGGGLIRAYAASSKNAVDKARELHKTTPVVTAALGRLMTATVIMGSMLKGDEIITCRINGDGLLGGIIATANPNGEVKGYPHNSYVDLPLNEKGKLDVSGAIGIGYLNVSKDLGLKEPYAGQVPLISGEIAEDFTNYYLVSEQTPAAVALGVLVDVDYTVKQSGGFVIQMLPGSDDKMALKLMNRLSEMDSVTTMMDRGEILEEILSDIFYNMDLNITGKMPAMFKCNCNREKLYKVLVALGKEELADIIEKDKKAVLKCHFCNSEYSFLEEELKQILLVCDK